MTDEQDGWVSVDEPQMIHLDDGLLGWIEWSDGPVCGLRGVIPYGSAWQCRLPPGHECRHLRATDELVREQLFHVTRIWQPVEVTT